VCGLSLIGRFGVVRKTEERNGHRQRVEEERGEVSLVEGKTGGKRAVEKKE